MQDLADQVARLLVERGLTIAVAEACTAGYVGHLLCSPPGASRYFYGGVIAYTGGTKTSLLGIPSILVDEKGSVSPEVALEMARRVRQAAGTDIGVSTTGVTGPAQGHSDRPIGFFHVGLSVSDGHESVHDFQWNTGRMEAKEQTARAALEVVRGYLSRSLS